MKFKHLGIVPITYRKLGLELWATSSPAPCAWTTPIAPIISCPTSPPTWELLPPRYICSQMRSKRRMRISAYGLEQTHISAYGLDEHEFNRWGFCEHKFRVTVLSNMNSANLTNSRREIWAKEKEFPSSREKPPLRITYSAPPSPLSTDSRFSQGEGRNAQSGLKDTTSLNPNQSLDIWLLLFSYDRN